TMILAIGGAGCNMAEAIMREASAHWVREVTYLFADTDQAKLAELAKKGFQTISLKDYENPIEVLKGVEKLYLLAGMGGKTGSEYVKIIAEGAKDAGVQEVSAIVTTPFYFEGEGKIAKAEEAIENLDGIKTTVLRNDDLLEKYADINFASAFNYADMAALKAIELEKIQ
ncbi:MAG: hypothetical protein K2J46_10335, partial [Muribaculaceae bacterium]|nr:hypothetical protein [Muribaculaceae bacterium]